jgi:hypothetical protein
LMSFSLRLVSDQSFAANAVRLQLHALAHNLGNFLRTPEPIKPASGRLKGSSPFDGSLRPDEPPDAGAARPAAGLRRRQGLRQRQETRPDRSLRQGRQGDTVEAIAPDAAALRSRHVARRLVPRLVLDVAYGLLVDAVVDVGRAQVAASCAGDGQE